MREALNREAADDDDPLHQNLTYRIARVQAKLSAQAARLLKERAGLSLTQWRIMKLIRTYGQANASALAEESTMDPGLFSRRLKTLIAQGYVQSTTDERDSRVQHLTLTPLGHGAYEKAWPVMRARREWLRGLLTGAEQKALFSALDKLDVGSERMDFSL